jgi:multicomponent Na+:H+ antiporter subunit D
VLTLFSMLKIWSGVFWGVPDETPRSEPIVEGRFGGPVLMVGATAVLASVSIAIAVTAGPLLDMAVRAGEDLLERDGYIEAVLGEAP